MERGLHRFFARLVFVTAMTLGFLQLPHLSAQIQISFNSQAPTCFGLPNGSITATATNGAGNYAYQWNNGQSGAVLTGLFAGTYSVTVTDGAGQTGTNTITLTQPSQVTATLTADQFCSSPFDITATGFGGVGGYNYNWSNGANTQTIFNVPAGQYCVTLTDANLCGVVECITVNANGPTVSVQTNNVTCPGGNNGRLTATPVGGTPPYNFLWSNGAVGPVVNNVTAGTYTVTLTDANGCTAVASGVVSQPPPIVINLNSNNPTCANGSNGSIAATVSGGTPPYTLLWNTGQSGSSIVNLPPGTYTLTVTDANGCVQVATRTLTPISNLTVGGVGTPEVCPGANNGFATVSAQNGIMPYTYLWSNGGTTQVLTNVAPGTYSVTVTDAVGCTGSTVVTVAAAPAFSAVATGSNPSTCGVNNGSATVTVTQGIGPFTYLWSNGGTTPTISNLGGGTYSVTVTNPSGCIVTASTTIVAPPNVFVNINATPRLCPGSTSGTATATATGGTPPFSFFWSTGASGATITNLSAGTYTVTVTDANGCTDTESATILLSPGVNINLTGTSIVCGAGATGSATAVPTSGTGPFQFQWSHGPTTPTVTGLTEGTYTVTVTDANGCFATRSININIIDDLAANVTGNSILCFGENNGSASATPSGGNMPYTFRWSNNSTLSSISGLQAGTYTVTVTDANGCTAVGSYTVTQPTQLNVNIQPSNPVNCFGQANASLTAVASGGTPAYSYIWSNGATTSTISNLPAGTYSVTVTDVNECTRSASFTVTQSQQINVNITGQTVICGPANSGTASAIVTGGTMPYSYLWSTGAVTSTINNLGSGTYTVTVTDANGCTGTRSITITIISNLDVNLVARPVLCFGGNTGGVLAQASGGSMPYSYLWSNGATSNEIFNLTAGTYTVTVTEANGCTVTRSVTVTQPPMLTANAVGINPKCDGASDGSAMAFGNGGTPPYQYLWSNGATTQNNMGLAAGTYSVTITDANFCTATASVTLVNPPALNVNVTAPTIQCGGTNSGVASAIVTGGTQPYTYMWSNGQTTASATNLPAGTYSLTVSDVNGCIQVVPAIILSELPMIAVSFQVTNIECSTAPIGSITATASNGTPPYTYSWSNGAATATINNLAAGTYTLTVTDANNCTVVQSATVTQTAGFTAGAPDVNVSCFGFADGSATAVPNGGVAPYSFIWSNGATTATISNLTAGTYSVTITDANECVATATANVTQPAQLTLNINQTNILCGGTNNGSATAVVAGGTSPYAYAWSNGASTATINNLAAGTYTVTVTDTNECTVTGSVTIIAASSLAVNITQNSGTCTNASQGILVANVTGGTGTYMFLWSNGATSATISNLAAGVYTVTVTDGNGCTATATAGLTVFPAPSCSVEVLQTSTLGNNGILRVNPTGGTAPYTFAWNTGAISATIDNLAPGTYTVTVTDANGCQTTCSATLQPLAGIGNYVWEDIDHDGQQDPNEPAIPNVTVHLKNAAGTIIATTTTDANGEYYFLSLAAGTYSVQFVVPAGMDYTASNTGNDALDSDIVPGMMGMTGTYTLDPGELDFTVDAGLFLPPNGAIVDPCTCLNNNTTEIDGQFDELFQITSYPNETWTVIAGSGLYSINSPAPPAAPIPVQLPLVLQEVSPGVYSFNFLLVHNITYTATITNGFSTLTVSNTCNYPTLNLEPTPPLDLCITDPIVALGGNPNTPGALVFTVNGVVVNMIDPMNLGIGTYELIATFTPLDPTECEVVIISTVNIHDDCVAKLGNYVWEDIDHDGQQDGFEPAIPNVTVHLKNASGTIVNTTVTNDLGEYCFYPLEPGSYSVQFVIPDGFDYTSSNQGDDALDSDIVPGMNGMTGVVVLEPGDVNLTVDGGIYVPPNGVIGDPCSCLNNSTTEDDGQFTETFTVRSYPNETWTVIGGSGMYLLQSDEPPIAPIPVTYPFPMVETAPGVYEFTFRLVDELSYVVITTNGFDTLSIGNTCFYPTLNIDQLPSVELCLADDAIELGANPNVPGNMIFTINGVPNNTIDPLELGVGSYELVATLIPIDPRECEASIVTQFIVDAECLATVGNMVWLDLDCDGIMDGGEPGIPGVEVTITGTAEFLDPNVNMTTFTNAQGKYQFEVPPGTYKLTFGTVPGYEVTAPNQGGNDELDSDVNPATMMTDFFHVEPDEVNLSFDLGFCPECINISHPGSIGYDQRLCAPGNDPAPLVSTSLPSGGSGPIEYMWMYTNGLPNTPIQYWEMVSGADGPSYDPGPLFFTTYFARCARVEDCGPFIESNIITITVANDVTAEISGPSLVCWNEPTTFSAVNVPAGAQVQWFFTGNPTPSSATGVNATATWSNVGNFRVELRVTHNGCTATAFKNITISTLPTVCGDGLVIDADATGNVQSQVMVSWEMSQAYQGLTYQVEQSVDGENFELAGTVTDAARTQNGVLYYEYYTQAPKMGRNFYRVRMSDPDGNSIHSNIAEVILFTDSKIAMLYPNPVENRLTVEIFETFNEEQVSLEIYSVSGQLMSQIPVAQGVKSVGIDFSVYPAGAYLIRLRLGETNVRTMKAIKN